MAEAPGWARAYNSRDEAGWTHTWAAALLIRDNGDVALRGGDGRVLTFVRAGDGFQRPLDLAADLIVVDGGHRLEYADGGTSTFDRRGRYVRHVEVGDRTDLTYDERDRLSSVTHSSGRRIDVAYDAQGRISGLRTADGRAVAYGYAADGALVRTASFDGAVTSYEYEDGRLVRVADPDGRTLLANAYDDTGRVVRQTSADGETIDVSYDEAGTTTVAVTGGPADTRMVFRHDAAGHVVGVTDPTGANSSAEFDEQGRIIGGTTAGGIRVTVGYDDRGNVADVSWGQATTRYAYDDRNRLAAETDPLGGRTTFEYGTASRRPTAVTDPLGNRTVFDVSDGLITRVVDPTGSSTEYAYDQRRNLTAVTDPDGHVWRHRYDDAGRRVETVTPAGDRTRYEYDPGGRVVAVTDPGERTRRFRYSASGLLLERTTAGGAVTSYEYTASGRLARVTSPVGEETTQEYDGAGNLTSMTVAGDATSTMAYDPRGRLTTLTAPDGRTTSLTYDPDGRVVREEDESGATTIVWDEQGNATEVTDATGAVWRYEYDLAGREISRTDPVGGVWRTSYDAAGRILTETDPAGAITQRTWTALGQPATVVDPLGRTTTYRYDAAGRVVKVTDPMGGVTRHVYDADGRRLSTTTPAGLTTGFRYADGRLAASIDPRGWITRYQYTPDGDRSATISPTGSVQRFEYDRAHRLTASIDPRGGVTRYTYDTAGNLITVTDAKGAVTRFTYDVNRRETSMTDPLGRVTRREYDLAGNLAAVLDPSGRTMRRTYDAAERLTGMTSGDDAISFVYDAAGRRTSMTDVTGTTTYTYDRVGRLTTVTAADGAVLSAGFDAAGQRTRLTYPDGSTVRFQYDLCGRLINVHDSEAGEVVYALDPDGRLLTEQLPRRWARRYRYEGGLLTAYRELREGAPAIEARMRYDADGRLVERTGGDTTETFGYDPAGQLVRFTRGGHDTDAVTLAYDAVGNRTSVTRGREQTQYRYDAADQLNRIDAGRADVRFRHDGAGRLIEETGDDLRRTVDYDGFGRPVVVTVRRDRDTERFRYTYDGNGLLAAVSTGSDARADSDHPRDVGARYLWDVDTAVPQILRQDVTGPGRTGSPAPADARFVYGHGRIFAVTGSSAEIFARAADGSAVPTPPTAPWVNAGGDDPFGDPRDVHADDRHDLPRFGYRGELEHDGAVYLRARYYRPDLGRFTTRDPISVLGGAGHTANPYVYAGNDPLNVIDPLGTIGIGIGTAIGNLVANLLAKLLACAGCPADPGNSHVSHRKCFQGTACLFTRGSLSLKALDADSAELNHYWNTKRPEAAAQAFTIEHLNWRRQNFGWKAWRFFGGATRISKDVDWETGQKGQMPDESDPRTKNFRFDILTEERFLFEVKRWTGPGTVARVQRQINNYISHAGGVWGLDIEASTELQDWANGFGVVTSLLNRVTGGSVVYVWGLNNQAGHIYFAKDEKAPAHVRVKVPKHDIKPPPIQIPIPIPAPRDPAEQQA
ncbi:RHS repeat-associated protein [Catenuloplanes nepalensis]|uniref:RHS repeat-associated protein n=1 Tax=Catenuloplanes nepalensis TaxID=587533 RepID=A0ABT9MTU8_9ACTN|nr:RHS repeat-associated core domain-containing protein [Catenuloplanes nepalensis]MDP9794451.1 RHS repeat-associated protein [Catenuloplanes nepalensis]